MTAIRRLVPISLALSLLLAAGHANASAAAPIERQGLLKSMAVGYKAFRAHRAEQGPGKIHSFMTKTGTAVREAGKGAKESVVQLGKRVGTKVVAVKTATVETAASTGSGLKRGLLGRMTISTVRALGASARVIGRGVRATGRVLAMPVKAVAKAYREEAAAMKTERTTKAMSKQMQRSSLTSSELMGIATSPRASAQMTAAAERALRAREQNAPAGIDLRTLGSK